MRLPSRRLLLGYSLFLVLCGTAGFVLSGFDLQQHVHGIRLAAAIAICGILAGRFQRNPALAMLAIDIATILILVMGLNYGRLFLKWYGIEGPGWHTSYVAASMAVGSLLLLPFLLWSRPKTNRLAIEWWRPSPLISLPILMLIRFPRCRHGLGVARRGGLTLGALMLIIGVVVMNGDRLPLRSATAMIQTARLAQEHHEFLRDVLDDPRDLKQILTDPEQLEALLDDPRAQDPIDDLTAEGGLLEGRDVAAMVERVAEGDLTALDELLDDKGMSGAKALLADISSEDSALSKLLDKDELDAARTLLSRTDRGQETSGETLDDDARSAAKKLLSSAADSDSTMQQNMASILQKVGGDRGAGVSGGLPNLGDIDINDPKILEALRGLDIDSEELAQLASGAANAAGLENKFGQQQPTRAAIANHLNSTAHSRATSKRPSERMLADRIEPQLQLPQLAKQSGGTFGSHNDPRLGLSSVQLKPAPQQQLEPVDPLDVFVLVDPQPDFLQQRLVAHFASESSPTVPNPEQPNAQQPSTPGNAMDAVTIASEPTPVEITLPQVDDPSTLVAVQTSLPAPIEIGRNDRVEPTTVAATHLGTRLPPMAGTLCMLAGLLTIGASLSRR